MPLTPEQIAQAVQKSHRGRGQIFQLRCHIWKWLQSTAWFARIYPEQHDQVNLVDEVEKIIRAKWSSRATATRRANAKARAKQEKLKAEEERQPGFDFD